MSGASMVPTLRDGDLVLARRARRADPGDVVLATYRSMPDRLVVKRLVRPDGDGWWLASDNPFAGGDSAVHGRADVVAVVRRVWPAGRDRRWQLPRRLPGLDAVSAGADGADDPHD